MLRHMKNSALLTLPAVCLIALVAGCHQKPAKTAAVRSINFVLTPDAAAKTVTVECVGSSSGKCGFAFEGSSPSDVLLDAGGHATVTGVAPGGQYCYGLQALNIASCHKRPLPTEKTTVNRELQANPAATPTPASN
jgi:hypothetical protein